MNPTTHEYFYYMGPKQEINPLQMAAAGLLGPNLEGPVLNSFQWKTPSSTHVKYAKSQTAVKCRDKVWATIILDVWQSQIVILSNCFTDSFQRIFTYGEAMQDNG